MKQLDFQAQIEQNFRANFAGVVITSQLPYYDLLDIGTHVINNLVIRRLELLGDDKAPVAEKLLQTLLAEIATYLNHIYDHEDLDYYQYQAELVKEIFEQPLSDGHSDELYDEVYIKTWADIVSFQENWIKTIFPFNPSFKIGSLDTLYHQMQVYFASQGNCKPDNVYVPMGDIYLALIEILKAVETTSDDELMSFIRL